MPRSARRRSPAITGGSQINFVPLTTGTLLPSYTIQIVKVDNTGTNFVETYAGCTASKFTIEQPEDDILTLEVEWDALSYTTGTGLASASYASTPTYCSTPRRRPSGTPRR
jgi:hypothetical protein